MATVNVMQYQVEITETKGNVAGFSAVIHHVELPAAIAETWRSAWAEWPAVAAAQDAPDPHASNKAMRQFRQKYEARLKHANDFQAVLRQRHFSRPPQDYVFTTPDGAKVTPFPWGQ